MASGQDLVQVSVQSLHKLITSIDDLRKYNESLSSSFESVRKDVSQLRNDNASLHSEVQRLQENSGSRFHRFSKLPTEIRCMIWKFALTAPQVHIIHSSKISRSQVNTVMQACREARSQGLKLQIPYYQISRHRELDPQDNRHYINLDVDTIWLRELTYILDELQFYCGRCPRHAVFPILGIEPECECQHKPRLRCLAIDLDRWENPQEVERDNVVTWDAGLTDILGHLESPQELCIVVEASNAIDRDVIFIEPTKFPNKYPELSLDGLPISTYLPRSLRRDWGFVEEQLEVILQDFKDARAELRRIEIEGKKINRSPK